jgi:hypothetical protein
MKKIFTLSALALTILFVGCTKDGGYYGGGSNESYWLSKERGEVVYSDAYCSYYVVETNNGYNILQAYGSYKPTEGSIIYGDLSYTGTREFYNRSSGFTFSGTVTDYWLTYTQAQNALDYYCPIGKGVQRQFKTADSLKVK